MNIKAERIEQLIQLVNRNLQLIFSGQREGVTPLEGSRLQKVDAIIFGQDKFAYEMVHFIAASHDKLSTAGTDVFSLWEDHFVRGLESLMVECAVIHDDIERDCFVSRVYCWFSEKLLERREVPRSEFVRTDDLRNSIVQFAGEGGHTTRALDRFSGGSVPPHRAQLETATSLPPHTIELDYGVQLPAIDEAKPTLVAHRLPLYVKHSHPAVLRSHALAETLSLPKVPGADENYGMLYSQPETEAEKTMNELWLARRRQEAFQFKTQQQLAVVMDRLALHKSRLESDALRRLETSNTLRRPQSAGIMGATPAHTLRPSSAEDRRGIINRLRSQVHSQRADSPSSSPERDAQSLGSIDNVRANRGTNLEDSTQLVITGGPQEKEAMVIHASRSSIMRQSKELKREVLPMRFKVSLPEGFSVDRQKYYMQLDENSDEEDTPHIRSGLGTASAPTGGAAAGKKKSAAPGRAEVFFKHEKPLVRERPQSARLFRQVSQDDPEFKVYYRHTNFRRKPLTEEQEKWLAERELERVRKSESLARQLVAAVAAKAEKKKNKDKGGDKGKKEKGDKKDKDKEKAKAKVTIVEQVVKPKYKSAMHFMSQHFPQFEDDIDGEAMAPMRTLQLLECEEIAEACERYHVPIRDGVLRKALVVPQDKPEAVCLEGLRDGAEGLMSNPLPEHLWRKFAVGKKGKGGKKKKGKK